ncbi:MAG: hypothetical protein IIZ78_06185 [Clostridiales bacterium]|nr:hypothetical protein [Clostridiales bacterium]
MKSELKAIPMTFRETNAYIARFHRHHSPVRQDRFRFGCELDGKLVGVIQVGNPVSRNLMDGQTCEVVRCCTDGTPNVCSFLYSRAARIAKEMGYKKIITYILQNELGTSLKASGWHLEEENVGGGSWIRSDRLNYEQLSIFDSKPKYPTEKKQRWAKILDE